ncbi:type II toxin-antitoxin system PemK/MazF family toxin [Cellulomonas sp. PhB150]|uniref:type II toxin-antitoxin system PemK/MazF family toxin n=1 Tax=Cellulomonas sp. PhB150 TaxID=2485188 RepID=UPI000F4724AE|nr:type II toxin-antitoxin system PemK/MazF family toxin [Cellulomonas sp. PhB150]
MVIARGEVYWADPGEPDGSRPALRRPVVVVQDDAYNASALATTLVAVMTSNTALAGMPGNVLVPAGAAGLPRDSVVNVTALVTMNKRELVERAGMLPAALAYDVSRGLAQVLGL